MISLETILRHLPKLGVWEVSEGLELWKQKLPVEKGIYFILFSDKILYIGSSRNLRTRVYESLRSC